jgi:prephenate dehydrogenase
MIIVEVKMTVQITIVGLGQIGASMGLALEEHKDLVYRVGHDREIGIAKRAEKLGALDKTMINLPSAAREADIILLSLPMDQIRETIEIIAPDLKNGAVIMDTGPVKEVAARWAADLLPEERYYVGLTPVLNPAYLYGIDSGLDAARPDLFRGGLLAIVSPPDTPSEAIKLAADLTRLLGANPLFADPMEMDGLMAATHTLPQLMAAALLNTTVDQPGWNEGRKVAGRSYAEATGSIIHPTSAQTLSAAALLNRDNVLRVIDSLIASLQSIRSDIDGNNAESLEEKLRRAREGWESWWKQRQTANWVGEEAADVEVPKTSDWFGRLLGMGGRKTEKRE